MKLNFKLSLKPPFIIHDVSDSYSWLKKGITAYTFGAILTPVEIEILEVDFKNKTATVKTKFQEGKLDFDRIYKTASECDFL